MNPTAAIPMSQEPHRRLASAAGCLACSVAVVAIESPPARSDATAGQPIAYGERCNNFVAGVVLQAEQAHATTRAGDRWADRGGAGPDQRVVPTAGQRRAAGPVLAGPAAGPRRRRGPGPGGVAARLPVLRDAAAGHGRWAVAQEHPGERVPRPAPPPGPLAGGAAGGPGGGLLALPDPGRAGPDALLRHPAPRLPAGVRQGRRAGGPPAAARAVPGSAGAAVHGRVR